MSSGSFLGLYQYLILQNWFSSLGAKVQQINIHTLIAKTVLRYRTNKKVFLLVQINF